MTAREIADRFWQQPASKLRYSKVLALCARRSVPWQEVVTLLDDDAAHDPAKAAQLKALQIEP